MALARALVLADNRLGEVFEGVPILLSATVESARATLSTMAGATITVAGIVVSVTIVSVQLASSQFSPRVLRGFLRDRFQQNVIGVVVGTFTYCLLVLTSVRTNAGASSNSGSEAGPTVALTVGVILAVVAVIAIVAFIDHSARAMQVGEIIQRVTDETLALIDHRLEPSDESRPQVLADGSPPSGPGRVIEAPRYGWLAQLDHEALLRALPEGAAIRLEVRVGDYLVKDAQIGTLWPEDAELAASLDDVLAVGRQRTMQQDIAFGIRQLVDIGLRALSPGINDPTTAFETLAGLASIMGDLLRRELEPRVITDDGGRRIYRARHLSHRDYVTRAFDQIRLAAASQPAVLEAMIHRLDDIDRLLRRHDLERRTGPLREQAELIIAGLDTVELPQDDRDRVRARADAFLASAT